MEDYPVQFMPKGNIAIQGIFPDAIDANVYFTGNHPALRRREGEGQNIGKIMMVQKTVVQLEEIIIVAENIREFGQLVFLPAKKGEHKEFQPFPFVEAAGDYEMEIDPGAYVLHGIS